MFRCHCQICSVSQRLSPRRTIDLNQFPVQQWPVLTAATWLMGLQLWPFWPIPFLKNCVFSLLPWRHCLYHAMQFCPTWWPLMNPSFIAAPWLNSSETRPPHAVDVTLPPGTVKGMERCSWGMWCIYHSTIWDYTIMDILRYSECVYPCLSLLWPLSSYWYYIPGL